MKERIFFLAGFFLFSSLISISPSFCQEQQPLVQEGIRQYYAENYEEAIEIFKNLREKDPESSQIAFFLGMSYKQINDFQSALQPLQEALTLKSPINEAILELVEVLYHLDKIEEASKWLMLGKKNIKYPAKASYLKGLILAKEGKLKEAIAAFEKSKSLDASYKQTADYQIGLAHLADRNYAKATERLQAAVMQDPLSDLASFARRYQDIVEERSYLERPLRINIKIMGQYDSNMLQEPNPATGVPDFGEERSLAMLNTFRIDYLPIFTNPWLFNASYALGNVLYEKNSTTRNTIANTIYVAPGYNFERFALNLATSYTHILRTDPSYKNYYETFAAGPLFRYLLTTNQILELYGAYTNEHYFTESLLPEENQNTSGLYSYIAWIWSFRSGGMVNLKYGYSDKEATGENWTNNGHQFIANIIVPVWKEIRMQLGGEVYLQNYRNMHTFYGVKREDKTYTAMAGFTWDFHKYVTLNAQYNYIRADSNIDLYDYDRHLCTVGVEFKF